METTTTNLLPAAYKARVHRLLIDSAEDAGIELSFDDADRGDLTEGGFLDPTTYTR